RTVVRRSWTAAKNGKRLDRKSMVIGHSPALRGKGQLESGKSMPQCRIYANTPLSALEEQAKGKYCRKSSGL
ncbi:MAG TPA: hypothetical protein VMT80_00720, partial [Candidatus Paceibacterota bacterium]|nr:hypothetical protein [Candidatus Paceibacterota bacterium]